MPDLIRSQAVVKRMLRAGRSFSEIEDFIEASSLDAARVELRELRRDNLALMTLLGRMPAPADAGQ
ncbi:MAG: hypothetical protein ACXVH3_35640 [Solirubrobacteraceae bacterium]